jgi:hypothetical protein
VEETPDSLSFGELSLDLDLWERRVVAAIRTCGNGDTPRWCTLVAEGIAYRAKCLVLSNELEQRAREEARAVDDTLTFDTAVGIALMAELQASIDHLIRAGKVAEMRKLTDFRNSVGDGLGRIRRAISDSERLVAKARSLDLIRDEYLEEEPGRKAPPEQFKREAPRVREISRRTVRKKSWIVPLLFVLFASAAAWLLLNLARTGHEPLPELTRAHFQHIPEVEVVTARPPSAYVQIDPAAWERMSPIERRSVLEQIGIVTGQAGYLGAHVRTTGGPSVGQWLEQGGARLLTRSAAEGAD